jgi:general stress protein YciG
MKEPAMKRFILMTATTLAIGAAGLIGCKKNQTAQDTTDHRTVGQKAGEAVGGAVDRTNEAAQSAGQRIGATTQPSADKAVNETRKTLGSVVQAAVTKDGLGDVVDHFIKADRDRIGKLDKSTWNDLNAAIDKFNGDWKAKYNEDFKITDKEQQVFGAPVEIQFGQANEARTAAEKTGPAEGSTNANAPDKSMYNHPRVAFPGMGGAAPLRLQLDNEGTVMASYKLQVPDTVDGNKLKDNLTSAINALDGMKDQWPADKIEAYRTVAAHVLAAITKG